jgi:predicted HTH transcriptional regulator
VALQRESARSEFEEIVVRLLRQNGSIASSQLAQAADVTSRTALRHLTGMVRQRKLVASGQNCSRVHTLRS